MFDHLMSIFSRTKPIDPQVYAKAYAVAEKHLGLCGRLVSASKSWYLERHPNDSVVFNANVCVKKLGKIWYGDLNITKSSDKLEALAKELGMTVYVLREMDARFENETKPLFDNAVVEFAGVA